MYHRQYFTHREAPQEHAVGFRRVSVVWPKEFEDHSQEPSKTLEDGHRNLYNIFLPLLLPFLSSLRVSGHGSGSVEI